MHAADQNVKRLAVGCMCGTSMDGIDAVLVRCVGRGLGLRMTGVVGGVSEALPERKVLARLAAGEAVTAGEITRAARALGLAHARAVETLLRETGVQRPDLVCVHGQTVWHQPPAGWQLMNPWPVVAAAGCPVVSDLRGMDLASGGQGAPVTPLADWVLFRALMADRVIVNLGGFCNITVLPGGDGAARGPEGVTARDVCACNQVLDAAARAGLGLGFDPNGSHAARGTPDPQAAEDLAAALGRQASSGRSLGSGDEAAGWVGRWSGRLAGEHLVATACRGVGGAIGSALREAAPAEAGVFVAGGSVRNRSLLGAIEASLGRPVRTTDELGVPAGWREGACFAVLGLLLADGVEITLPGVTGRAGPIGLSGAWTYPPQTSPGSGPPPPPSPPPPPPPPPRPTGGTC